MGRIGLALLGVVVAAGIGLAASSLVSQPIGLSGEPVTAGGDLAPASDPEPEPAGRTRTTTTTVTTTTAAPPSRTSASPPPAEAGDDESGEAPDGDD